MTHLFTNRTPTMSKSAKLALSVVLLATTLMPAPPALAEPINSGGQQLEGAWLIRYISEGGASKARTSGFFTRDGSVFVQNVLPNSPGMVVMHGTGEWVRSGNREFDVTWIYPVASSLDGAFMGIFKDRAKLRLSEDGAVLEGVYTFELTLADGTVAFGGKGSIKMVRVLVEPLP